MVQVALIILLVFLAARFGLWLGQLQHNRHASGKNFKRALAEGRLDGKVYDDAVWNEVDRFGRKRLKAKISKQHRRTIREAKLAMREDFLDDITPGFYQYIIVFLIASVLGLLIETVWMLIMFGSFESRVGLVWGPFSPLYGFGAVALTLVLWNMRKRPWWQVFIVSAVVGGLLEQLTGWGMEYFMDATSWSYLHLPDHITKWVAWRFLAMWGVLGLVWCRVIMPEMIYRIGEPTCARQTGVVAALTVFMALDMVMTVMCFYRADQRAAGIPPKNGFERYVDVHFDDSFIERKFENVSIGGKPAPADAKREGTA